MAELEPGLPPPADAREDASVALQGFVDKWLARWPEWAVAEVFVPVELRLVVRAWASLQQELIDAAWGGSDPRPGEAKLGWWQEELVAWQGGIRRHPLGSVLQRQPAPWRELAATLPSLAGSRVRPGDEAEAFEAVAPFAAAVAAVDAAVFAAVPDAGASASAPVAAATLLQWRLLLPGDDGVPLAVLAATVDGADAKQAWAGRLLERWPEAAGAPRARRLWSALARGRLAGTAVETAPPAWRVLWGGWRAARG